MVIWSFVVGAVIVGTTIVVGQAAIWYQKTPEERQAFIEQQEQEELEQRRERAKAQQERARRRAAELRASRRQDGSHCLHGGRHIDLIILVRQEWLKDPGSFSHVSTRISGNVDGQHLLTMRYRARNSFGGMDFGTVVATVNHTSCVATIVGFP